MAPDLTGTETPYQFGYVTLVISGAQRAVERPSDINYPAALKYLLKSRAPPDVPDIVGYSALQHATMNHLAMVDLARLLLEHGADPNHRNRYGEVALIPAFEGNQHGIIDLLLEFGADLNIPEADGLAPTQLFLRYGPQVTVTVRKWMRRRAGEQAPMSDKKCDGCGKEDDQLKMFPLPLCALLHSGLPALPTGAQWKLHKPNCQPSDASNTITVKPRYKDMGPLRSNADMVRQMLGVETQPVPKSHQRSAHAPRIRPGNGKFMIVKVQVPMDPLGLQLNSTVYGDLLIYTKKRDFVCMVVRSDDTKAYDAIAGAVRTKGVGGAKAHFSAKLLSKDKLVIKVGEVLAEQPF
ncbi:hypothetical protein CERSUDRAFT_99077 [Gelatoporia subvermispora B]|uniref:Uncharacterized protein n=1 Tax=Ceriporiopsis subvermispora (strain B) TaxID=914234 RepID=M2QKM9_CERS8|nr:hypothetical protein CERSUDRAFT_99077 [Gelatoporia subvermispora B]